MVARELVLRYGCSVVGLDQSLQMLLAGRAEHSGPRMLVHGQAERLPFGDAAFDHVTFTYLLRYVDDPAATLRELARVLRPGGRLAAVEFGVPPRLCWRIMWRLYTRIGLPLAGRLLSSAWAAVGDFLGRNIEQFNARHPQAEVENYWREAGLHEVVVQRMSLGGGIVMCAMKGCQR